MRLGSGTQAAIAKYPRHGQLSNLDHAAIVERDHVARSHASALGIPGVDTARERRALRSYVDEVASRFSGATS